MWSSLRARLSGAASEADAGHGVDAFAAAARAGELEALAPRCELGVRLLRRGRCGERGRCRELQVVSLGSEKFVDTSSKVSVTMAVGPLFCLAMLTSTSPSGQKSLSRRA